MKYCPKRYSIRFSQTCVQRNGLHKLICHWPAPPALAVSSVKGSQSAHHCHGQIPGHFNGNVLPEGWSIWYIWANQCTITRKNGPKTTSHWLPNSLSIDHFINTQTVQQWTHSNHWSLSLTHLIETATLQDAFKKSDQQRANQALNGLQINAEPSYSFEQNTQYIYIYMQ